MERLKVFLSSAMTGELDAEREHVSSLFKQNAMLKGFADLYAIENYASPRRIDDEFVQRVQRSDIVILLLDKKLRNAVVKEFETAIESNKKLFIYHRDKCEDREPDLTKFINDVLYRDHKLHCGSFTNAEDLCRKIVESIIDNIIINYVSIKPESSSSSYSDSVCVVPGTMPNQISDLYRSGELEDYRNDETISTYDSDQLVAISMYLMDHKWDLKHALIFIELAIDKDPNNWLALHNKGYILSQIGLNDDAYIFFEKALKINPNSDPTCYSIGRYFREKGEEEEALNYFEMSLSINPQKLSPLSHIVNIYLSRKDYNKALYYAEKAISLEGADTVEFANLALCKALNDDYDSAYDLIDKIDQNSSEYYRAMSLIKDIRGDYEGAIRFYDLYFGKVGYDYFFCIKKAFRLLDLNRIDFFIDWIKELEDNYVIEPEDYNNLGYQILCSGENNDIAIDLFKKSIDLNPSIVEAWLNLQMCYVNTGDLEKGLLVARQGYKKHPYNPTFANNIMKFLTQLGRLDELEYFVFDRSVSIFGDNLNDDQKSEIFKYIKDFQLSGGQMTEEVVQQFVMRFLSDLKKEN